MKQEKYILWGSIAILIISSVLFVVVDGPKKTKEETSHTSVKKEISLDTENTKNATSSTGGLGTTTPQEPDARFNTKLWSATYTNNTYGFTLVFPDSWSSYTAKEIDNGVQFGVEGQEDVFTIVAYTNKEWEEKIQENKRAGTGELPGILKKNDAHVFTVKRASTFSEKVLTIINVYPSILTTFTFRK